MTAIAIFRQKFTSFPLFRSLYAIYARFSEINRRGIITIALIALGGVSVIGYLATLYWIFSHGFEMRERMKYAVRINDETTMREVALHRKEAEITQRENEFLGTMEKISQIKYITEESVARSYTVTNP